MAKDTYKLELWSETDLGGIKTYWATLTDRHGDEGHGRGSAPALAAAEAVQAYYDFLT